MNKNLLTGIAVLALIGVAGYAVYTMNKPAEYVPPAPGTPVVVPVPTPVPVPVPVSQTPGAPAAITGQTAVPSMSTVVVTGSVVPNGALTTYWYEYGKTTGLGTRTSAQSVGSGYTSIYAPSYITGLSSSTTYYYKLSAENRFGTVNGATYNFTTNTTPPPQGSAPTTRTTAASGISRTTANLNGQVDPNLSETRYWFEYGETTDLGFLTSFQSAGNGDSSSGVEVSVSGLRAVTKYYFRLNAQNQFGTSNGAILNFTTQGPAAPSAPSVDTNPATNVNTTSAKLNGSINPNGASTQYWFEYSEDSLLGSFLSTATPSQSLSGTSNVSVSANVSSLNKNTKYFFRLVAQNSEGTVRGNVESFMTKP